MSSAVDADGSIGTGIVFHLLGIRKLENALSREAAFHGAVGVVPMVEDAQFVGWLLADAQVAHILTRLLQSQQMEGTIEKSCIVGSLDDGLSAFGGDAETVLYDFFLLFEYHGTSLPVLFQFIHGGALHTSHITLSLYAEA